MTSVSQLREVSVLLSSQVKVVPAGKMMDEKDLLSMLEYLTAASSLHLVWKAFLIYVSCFSLISIMIILPRPHGTSAY